MRAAAGKTMRPQTSMSTHRATRSAPDPIAAASSSTSTGKVNAEMPSRKSSRAAPVSRPRDVVTNVVRAAAAIAGHSIRPPSTGRTSWKIDSVATAPAANEIATKSEVMAQMYGAPPPKERRPARTCPQYYSVLLGGRHLASRT
jgi:hypothetical protein